MAPNDRTVGMTTPGTLGASKWLIRLSASGCWLLGDSGVRLLPGAQRSPENPFQSPAESLLF